MITHAIRTLWTTGICHTVFTLLCVSYVYTAPTMGWAVAYVVGALVNATVAGVSYWQWRRRHQ